MPRKSCISKLKRAAKRLEVVAMDNDCVDVPPDCSPQLTRIVKTCAKYFGRVDVQGISYDRYKLYSKHAGRLDEYCIPEQVPQKQIDLTQQIMI
jgi:hypothetical protein